MAPAAGPSQAATAEPGAILRAAFKGRIDLGDGPRRFEGTLAAGLPGSLRVEITGPMGGVRALIAAGENRVLVLCPGTREYFDEAATADVFESLLGLGLETRDLVALIRLGYDGTCPDEVCETTLPMQPDSRAARRLVVRRQGAVIGARPAAPEATGEATGEAAPGELRSLELRLDDTIVTREGPIPSDLFSPTVPAGWTRVRVASLPAGGLLPQPR